MQRIANFYLRLKTNQHRSITRATFQPLTRPALYSPKITSWAYYTVINLAFVVIVQYIPTKYHLAVLAAEFVLEKKSDFPVQVQIRTSRIYVPYVSRFHVMFDLLNATIPSSIALGASLPAPARFPGPLDSWSNILLSDYAADCLVQVYSMYSFPDYIRYEDYTLNTRPALLRRF